MGAADDRGKDAIREARERLAAAEREYEARVRQARELFGQTEREHDRSLKEAEDHLKDAVRNHDRSLRDATGDLAAAQTGQLLGSYGNVRLYSNRLETPDGTVEISPAVRATVETSGAKSDKADTREVLLLLDTPRFDSVIRGHPGDATPVREFAAKINTAAKNAAERTQSYEQTLANAQQRFDDVNADRGAIEAAQAAVDAVRSDTGAVEAAARELEAARSETSALDSRRSELTALDPKAKVKKVEDRASRERSIPGLAWWGRRGWPAKIALIVAAIFVALITLGAILGPDTPEEDRVAATTAPVAPPGADLVIESGSGPITVRRETYAIEGSAARGAVVSIGGTPVGLSGGRFAKTVRLRVGRNTIRILAVKGSIRETAEVLIDRRPPFVSLAISQPNTGDVVTAPTVSIAGTATSRATVVVRGQPVSLSGTRFRTDVSLSPGRNSFLVVARKPGFAPRAQQIVVTRRLSPAEIAAQQAQRRQRFIDSTVTIPYKQLIKDPESYSGTKVRYYGEILQIQESGGAGGIILLYVTDLGYDIWSDQVWVNYTGHVRGGEGDKLTVYGVVVGTKSYDTQIGGTTYVPEIDATYIVE
ncbi:MAG: hypothetical protein M3540_05600 [Actinomycetota bacterium]|nr:hypothetical protein [Actinomycetota bacterium]